MEEETLIFSNFNDIFDLLIREEQEAIEVYNSMARRSERLDSRKTFEQFARDKMAHVVELKQRRSKYPSGPFDSPLQVNAPRVTRRAEGLKRMSYHDIMSFAIEEERKSEHLYQTIARQMRDQQVHHLFELFGREEKKHRLRLEKILAYGE